MKRLTGWRGQTNVLWSVRKGKEKKRKEKKSLAEGGSKGRYMKYIRLLDREGNEMKGRVKVNGFILSMVGMILLNTDTTKMEIKRAMGSNCHVGTAYTAVSVVMVSNTSHN